MGELKPCPFCGGEARQSYNNVMIKGVSEKCAWVYCKKCSARTGYFRRTANEHYIGESAKAWNRRAVETAEWDVTVCTRCGHDLSGWADGAYEAVADGDVHYCPSCGALNKARRKENA